MNVGQTTVGTMNEILRIISVEMYTQEMLSLKTLVIAYSFFFFFFFFFFMVQTMKPARILRTNFIFSSIFLGFGALLANAVKF
jgi:hypothetical protein